MVVNQEFFIVFLCFVLEIETIWFSIKDIGYFIYYGCIGEKYMKEKKKEKEEYGYGYGPTNICHTNNGHYVAPDFPKKKV